MTFEVRVKCLICKKLTDPTINSNKETNAEALNLLHNKLCAALKLEFSPEFREWDFADEPFPYCESCGQRLQRLGELMDQLKSIEEEISGALATVSALVITSEKSDTYTSDPLVTPKLGQMKEYFKGRRLQEKQNYFRSLIIQRYDPRVTIELIDPAWNHPALCHEQHNYELLPKPLLLKTEPAIEEFSDTAAAEGATESEAEYKVELGSDLISGADEGIRQYETGSSSLTQVPTLACASIASGKPESAITPLPNANVFKKQVRSKQCILRFDKSSKTGEFNGLTFKELEDGSYKCCTCGLVYARHIGTRAETVNIRHHISRVHMRSSTCKECGQVFKSCEVLYKHRKRVHQAHKFQCGLCGEKFPLKGELKCHVLRNHEEGEMPYSCDECGQTFFRRAWLESHSQMHVRARAIGVETEKPTTTFPSVNNPGRQTTRVCVDCGKVCSSFRTLSKHRAMAHYKSKKLQCDRCGANFPFQSQLKRHEASHRKSGESPYSSDRGDKRV